MRDRRRSQCGRSRRSSTSRRIAPGTSSPLRRPVGTRVWMLRGSVPTRMKTPSAWAPAIASARGPCAATHTGTGSGVTQPRGSRGAHFDRLAGEQRPRLHHRAFERCDPRRRQSVQAAPRCRRRPVRAACGPARVRRPLRWTRRARRDDGSPVYRATCRARCRCVARAANASSTYGSRTSSGEHGIKP